MLVHYLIKQKKNATVLKCFRLKKMIVEGDIFSCLFDRYCGS